MTARMHREDLRAIMAAVMSTDNQTFTGNGWREHLISCTDNLLEDLARTAKPLAQEWPTQALERIEWWTARCAEWEARATKAEGELARIVDGGVNQTLADLRARIQELEGAAPEAADPEARFQEGRAQGAMEERERIIQLFTRTVTHGGLPAVVVSWDDHSVVCGEEPFNSDMLRKLLGDGPAEVKP